MARNRQGVGLATLRILLGVFLLFEGVGKLAWIGDSGLLTVRLIAWVPSTTAVSRWYLESIALPGAPLFARLVVAGELAAGLALLLGVWTRIAALLAFFMVLNFHFASGRLFQYDFLSNGYGLPVLGGMLAIAIDGAGFRWGGSRGRESKID